MLAKIRLYCIIEIMVFNNSQNYPYIFTDYNKISSTKSSSIFISQLWFFLAIFSISLSGFFAFFITIARTPHIYEWLNDPDFFKKALVIHVNLGFLFWLSCFIAAVFTLISIKTQKKIFPFFLSLTGIFCITIPSFFVKGEAVLSNYVPMIDHPVFLAGIFLFCSGIFLNFFDFSSFISNKNSFLPKNSIIWIQVSAITFIIAFELGILSYIITPKNFDLKNYYEILFWAPGHLFVFSIEALKISIWFLILSFLFPEITFFKDNRIVKIIAILYTILPLYSLTMIRYDTFSNEFRNFFTQLMRWGIFPFVCIILAGIFFHLFRYLLVYNKKISNSYQKIFFYMLLFSSGMTLLGYLLGALIRIPNTMIPGHYHASIGSITLTLMIGSILLLEYFGYPVKNLFERKRLFSYQSLLYGIGQTLFAIGFAFAGIHGQGRKIFAKEQEIRGIWDYLGLGFMGLGGIIAILGGILFIIIVIWTTLPILHQIKVQIYKNIQTKINFKEVLYGKKTSHTKIHG